MPYNDIVSPSKPAEVRYQRARERLASTVEHTVLPYTASSSVKIHDNAVAREGLSQLP